MTILTYKEQAKRLQQALTHEGAKAPSLQNCQHLVAQSHGFPSWHHLCASRQATTPAQLGQAYTSLDSRYFNTIKDSILSHGQELAFDMHLCVDNPFADSDESMHPPHICLTGIAPDGEGGVALFADEYQGDSLPLEEFGIAEYRGILEEMASHIPLKDVPQPLNFYLRAEVGLTPAGSYDIQWHKEGFIVTAKSLKEAQNLGRQRLLSYFDNATVDPENTDCFEAPDGRLLRILGCEHIADAEAEVLLRHRLCILLK